MDAALRGSDASFRTRNLINELLSRGGQTLSRLCKELSTDVVLTRYNEPSRIIGSWTLILYLLHTTNDVLFIPFRNSRSLILPPFIFLFLQLYAHFTV